MDPIDRLASMFARFPGIGIRQSRRFAFHVLSLRDDEAEDLIRALRTVRERVRACVECGRFFSQKHEDGDRCPICLDESRDDHLLMILERDADLDAMERSGAFRGRYVVLGGGIPLHADGTEVDIRLARLRDRVSRDARVLREIIVGMPLTPEGEHTADYVREAILRALGETDVPITTLGRGLSTGSELEYADAETLRFALMGRK